MASLFVRGFAKKPEKCAAVHAPAPLSPGGAQLVAPAIPRHLSRRRSQQAATSRICAQARWGEPSSASRHPISARRDASPYPDFPPVALPPLPRELRLLCEQRFPIALFQHLLRALVRELRLPRKNPNPERRILGLQKPRIALFERLREPCEEPSPIRFHKFFWTLESQFWPCFDEVGPLVTIQLLPVFFFQFVCPIWVVDNKLDDFCPLGLL